MAKLDLINRRLLSELSEDARQEYSVLAKKMSLGRDRIKYRLQSLQDSGVITGFIALMNPTVLGITLYKSYFRLRSDRRRIPKLLAYIDKHPRTFWAAECVGKWDLVVVTFARSPKEFVQLQDHMLGIFSRSIVDLSVFTITDAWYFGRGYLTGDSVEKVYVGGSGKAAAIDPLDHRILQMVAANARISYVDMASKLKMAPATVRNRLLRLETQGIIAYSRLELNLSKIQRSFYKAQIYLSEYDPRREDEFRAYCRTEPDIVFLLKQIGECRLEIELEVESFDSYNQIIDRLRDRFSGFINRVDTILVRKQRIRGVPMDAKGPRL